MSSDISIHANHNGTELSTRIRKLWEYQKYADEDTAYSFSLKTNEGDEVTLFVTMGQLETIGDSIDKFIASAVDIPEPTINDLVRSQAESEQGFSLA